MATVTIPLEDGGNSIRMPRLCIVCGSSRCRQKRTTFSARYTTLWGLGRGGTRFLYTTVPLCTEHWGHFDAYQYLGLGLFGVVFLSIVVAAILAIAFKIVLAIPVALGIGLLSMLGYLIVSWSMKQTMVHATSITTDEVTLRNVHHKFADAVEGPHEVEDLDDGPQRDEGDESWGFRKRDRDTGMKIALWIWLGIGGFILLMFCGVGTIVMVFILSLKPGMPPGPGPAPKPGPGPGPVPGKPTPLPIDPAWDDKTMRLTYLSDLQEHDAHVGWGQFGKNGLHGFDHKSVPADRHRVKFNGKEYPRALSTHAATASAARVKYRLGGQYRLFRGAAAMADLPPDAWSPVAANPVTFSILGDGRLLWVSRPLQKKGDGEAFRLGVSGVKELELRAACAGQAEYTWSVWLTPHLLE